MKETKAYWGKDNCFVDVRLPDSETEVIRFWNDQLNESYEPKTLTDEEIDIALYVADITLDNLSDGDISMERIKAFVRTVLRKAQENEILEKKTT